MRDPLCDYCRCCGHWKDQWWLENSAAEGGEGDEEMFSGVELVGDRGSGEEVQESL